MEKLNDILHELGISKVKLAKFLGVSRQMIYNYLEMDDINKYYDVRDDHFIKLINNNDEQIKEKIIGSYFGLSIEEYNELIKKVINTNIIKDKKKFEYIISFNNGNLIEYIKNIREFENYFKCLENSIVEYSKCDLSKNIIIPKTDKQIKEFTNEDFNMLVHKIAGMINDNEFLKKNIKEWDKHYDESGTISCSLISDSYIATVNGDHLILGFSNILPSDIIGTQTFNSAKSTFETKMGPVYANFVLLDEINRSSAKTQSAMLEAMQERQVTIGGVLYPLPPIFIVIATQNPIEQEGTYPLAEAQLDRFLIKEVLDYPTPEEEVEILNRIEKNIFASEQQILPLEAISFLQDLCKKVYIDNSIKIYITKIVDATRHPKKYIDEYLAKYVLSGASTRAGIAFMEGAKAVALINGRNFVTPNDIKSLKYSILRHRITLNFAALADNIKVETIIDAIFGAIKTP